MTYTTSARGGYLLNSGYLSTNGSQIVDSAGFAVRIASIGWNNGDSTNYCPDGLYSASYTAILDSVKADGFNTIRFAYCDVALANSPAGGQINTSIGTNSALAGKTFLQVLDAIVTYCGTIGLKVIIDHHNNEGGSGGGGGQQGNGLWYDLGSGSNGTDGSGNTGTVTQAIFQSNWVALATRYAGNSTVIGFDLANEPTAYGGKCSWGDGGSNDIHAMYQTVGNAILAVNPGVLIICEGPQNYNGQFQTGGASGSSTGTPMPFGDISLVPTVPVVLNVPNKVVYSIHIYPSQISSVTPDSGTGAITRYNAQFGFLYTGTYNAPVWIGEMGASLDGVGPDSTGSQLAAQQAWGTLLLSYMNGGQSASGGPVISTGQQPISGSWWVLGYKNGQSPDGTQSAWGTGNYRTGQQTYTDQMLFTAPLNVSAGITTSAVNNITAGTTTTIKATSLFNEVNTGSGATTITLPTMTAVHNANGIGHLYVIKDSLGIAGTSTITVTPSGGATIDGASSAVIITNYGSLTLIPNGNNWNQVGLSSGSVPNRAIFTASGTWTVPIGVTRCYASVWGGGGGSGATYASGSAALGGGGGGYAEGLFTGLTPGAGITVTVGAGGTAGAYSATPASGGTGGSTSFGAYISASGGTGGLGANGGTASGVSNGGSGFGGDLQISGGECWAVYSISTGVVTSAGGAAYGGSMAHSGATNASANGIPGHFPGGGASGSAAAAPGAAGGGGLVIIRY